MLSKAMLHSLHLILKVGFATGAFPYKWDHQQFRIIITKSRLKSIQWIVTVVYMFINVSFMIFRNVQAKYYKSTQNEELFMNMIDLFAWIISSVIQLNTIIKARQVPVLVNQMMKISAYFASKKL